MDRLWGCGVFGEHNVLMYSVDFTGTHRAYPQRDGQAELIWVACLCAKMVYLHTEGHPFQN